MTKLDNLFRNRVFWGVVLFVTYLLPALTANVPVALAMPWVLIPRLHEGVYEFLLKFGMPSFYDTKKLLFAIVVHGVFWSLCILLVVWGNRLRSPILRTAGCVFLVLLVVTIYGCSSAIDSLRH